MSKERLSKLQKWILEKCVEDLSIPRDKAREFYGKYFSPKGRHGPLSFPVREEQKKFYDYDKGKGWREQYRPKKEFLTTRAMEATISRTFRNLVGKGYLVKERFGYQLTEKGWLKVNKNQNSEIVNFKDYKDRVDEITKMQTGWAETLKTMAKMAGLPKKRSVRDRELRAAKEAVNKKQKGD